ncbi:MAG: 3-oxo-5-alpha-steroid 4-dehydrogenase 1 [Polyangiales bacterium]|jgi:3-oxo-5-alpha-steroid 4-dehydrogenase 1
MSDLFSTHPVYASTLVAILGAAALSFPVLFFVIAPYGRHHRAGFGPTLKAKWGWVLMEAPSPLSFLVVFATTGTRSTAAFVLCGMWLTHYLYRSFVFPFRMRGGDKPKPWLTVLLAILFNGANGSINAFAITNLAPHLEGSTHVLSPFFFVGAVLFFFGFALNLHSDGILRSLRKPGETGYKIPYGGGFRFVTSPNYLGEIVEWCGFALCAWTGAAAAFALFTAANLVPRAVSHHRWYREKFENYPNGRRAILPGLL